MWSIVDALYPLANNWITFPNPSENAILKHSFYQIAGFPRVIGCIDGTNIKVSQPLENAAAWKGFHSINAMAICNANYKFMYASAHWPGSCHDSFILRNSQL